MVKSDNLYMVCAMRSYENVKKDNNEKWLQSDVCELGFEHMTDKEIADALVKQKGEEGEGGWEWRRM
jgi:hypothetical protein